MFCNTKDSLSVEEKSVIYTITYTGGFQRYIGETDRKFITRLDKHDTKVDQPMYQHLSNCSAFNDHIMLFTLSDATTKTTIFTKELHLRNAVINNVKILNKRDKRDQIQFLEACYIKTLIPEITSKQSKKR